MQCYVGWYQVPPTPFLAFYNDCFYNDFISALDKPSFYPYHVTIRSVYIDSLFLIGFL